MKKYIKIYEEQGVYYINTSEKIPGRSFSQSDFAIYGMKMEEDEFDIYEGQYMITVDCNADEMQCKYTFFV